MYMTAILYRVFAFDDGRANVDCRLGSLVGRLAPIWFLRKERLIQPGTIPVFDRRGKGKPYLVSGLVSQFLSLTVQTRTVLTAC